jgi:endonuclease/exonuclease/phosphatase family metal-dependent hydrolase
MRIHLLLLLTIGLAFESSIQAPHGARRDLKNRVSSQSSAESDLLEIGRAAKLWSATKSPPEIKVVSYNIRWRGGKDLIKLAEFFKGDTAEIGGASIIGLQEVDRNRKRTGNKNTVKALADDLGMYYAWSAPPVSKSEEEEETGVAILSPYPLTQVHRIVLPHEGPGKRRRVALGATVNMPDGSLRVYSVHSENRISVKKKLDQMEAVLADLKHYGKHIPAIILGDLNTWEMDAGPKTIKLFTSEGFDTPFHGRPTFKRRILFFPLLLKLDWIWLRHLQTISYGIDNDIVLSDHWPLWVTIKPKSSVRDK